MKEIESPFYKKPSDKITAIEITLKRENEADICVAFMREDKIKDLIENEPFFRDLANSYHPNINNLKENK